MKRRRHNTGLVVERAFRVILLIQRRGARGVSVWDVADEIGVTKRQAQRYIHALAALMPLAPRGVGPEHTGSGVPPLYWTMERAPQ